MTIQGAITELDLLIENDNVPFYVKPSLEKIKETVISEFAVPERETLEKIRAEIENIPNDDTTKPIGTYDYCIGAENERKLILSIIDKYIGGN